jgi:large subunit ribosomal protein L22
MGARKKHAAETLKAAKKAIAIAKLNDCPTSPRKMRLVADQIRGVEVEKALAILKYSPKDASNRLEKLLLSAIANWQAKTRVQILKKLV